MSRMEDFREFVAKYPKLKDEVRNKKRTWQEIYEDFVLLGDDGSYLEYRDEEITNEVKSTKRESKELIKVDDNVKQVIEYIKKINPDTITKTISTVQKVVGMVNTMNPSGGSNKTSGNPKPIFNQKFNVNGICDEEKRKVMTENFVNGRVYVLGVSEMHMRGTGMSDGMPGGFVWTGMDEKYRGRWLLIIGNGRGDERLR